MSNIDKSALREAAEKATPGPWYVHDKPCEDGNYGIDTSDKEFLAEAVVWWGFARQSIWREEDAKHIAAANPATVLALLDELEAAEKKTVEMPTFDGYVPHVARELHAAFRIACDNAGINVTAAGKGEAS
ncbi:ead/Ea22-like family protein [Enterobacter hormaechei]|uniref:ead/Ea22-like family protein n=1 Tax=Enterobacter hormaechei TaxID=158836 RepID=UPI00100A1A97|nr:ead/Ea22-like family protein [Enterobacter hormaechei]ELX8430925.1 ead/Ea22-like family protein [Enterobacter hormaechei subsp. hoffmannii]EKP1101044.1 ead/Ea22-like family protein [Enterobacter hormaechei]EKS6526607.1 ead/Ea22-like family protein [Enterobacter hormaechei]EKU5018277.1 ead/Ea22-like family protein [Enterobacter hormaechei]EKW1081244.1 ead/Ea22-like family protein [Enterobacter hormaechei]